MWMRWPHMCHCHYASCLISLGRVSTTDLASLQAAARQCHVCHRQQWHIEIRVLSNHGFDFRKIVEMQNETILHIVSEFQANRACFHRQAAGANFGRKMNKKKRRKKRKHRTCTVTIKCLRLYNADTTIVSVFQTCVTAVMVEQSCSCSEHFWTTDLAPQRHVFAFLTSQLSDVLHRQTLPAQ